MVDLKYVGLFGEQERERPLRFVLRVATTGGKIREVVLAPSELAHLAQRSVTLLAHHVDYRMSDA